MPLGTRSREHFVVPRGEARNGVWVVPSIKNTCYNGTQMIKTKLISEKIMIYPGASAPGKLYLASPLVVPVPNGPVSLACPLLLSTI
jgi:hypothetical protein